MRLIDADNLRQRMYHEAFETDTDLQRWDSGCWIRYKMFEEIIESQPTIDAVPVIRCKDCSNWERCDRNSDCYGWCDMHEVYCPGNWYCGSAIREEEGD